MIKKINLTDIHVGQFLLSCKKLLGAFDNFSITGLKPFTYRLFKDRPTLTDGHHTSFITYLFGVKEIEIILDNDDYDWGKWELSTAETWRRKVLYLSDFVGRIVDHEEYIRSWIGYCESLNLETFN